LRTLEEIKADIRPAMSRNDAAALRDLVQELQHFRTDIAEAVALKALGWVDCINGDYDSALERYNRSMALHQELDDRDGVASVTNVIGILYYRIGNYANALEHFLRAQALFELLGDRDSAASSIGNIGNVYHSTGDYPSALEYYKRALAQFEEAKDRSGVALFTGNLGSVYHSTGEHALALDHYRRALAEYEELGNRAGVAAFIGNLGDVASTSGDQSLALDHYQRALAVHEELGDRLNISRITGNIIQVLLDQRAFDEAEVVLDRQAATPMVHPAIRAAHATRRARVSEHKGDLEEARDYLRQALQISSEAGIRDHAAEYHELLRDLAKKRNDFEDYIHHNTEFLRITEEIRGKEATQKMAIMEAERKAEAVERERVKERALLYGALPESVATRMLRGEDVSGDHYENVSVLFLDIAGFTAISDRIPAGHVVHLLKAIFRVCDEACKAHSLTKIKTIGDSYLAVAFPDAEGRGPKTHHAENAARAAIDMLQKLNALELTMDPTLGDTAWTQDVGEIRVRIGLHCGPIVAGVVGDERLQYDVWGDTVNVASRMESTGEPGRIHVSSAFADALRGLEETGRDRRGLEGTGRDRGGPEGTSFGLRERGTVEVKGKGSMKTFWLEGA
jgi:adenylate cyclase